ncbi:TIGR03857 family LLM class F420-dependent oxidoreductase [Nocardioides sp.]|uniref:TIGR03857 family LLM class F420-dependent oxidoreductase n=1 Tax=Nocardioides sp. TaxID=35761 RepID=UPI003567FDF6
MSDQLNELAYYAVTHHPADARKVFSEATDAEGMGLGSCMISERFTVKEAGVLAGAVAGRAPSLGIASAAINHHTRHPVITAAMGSTLKAITEGRYAMSFGRGSAEHWRTLGLPVVTEAMLRDFLGMLRQLWTDGFVLDHDGPAGAFPVLHNLHGLEGGGPPLGLVAVGPKTMALAGEMCDFVIMHTFFSEQATTSSIEAVRRGAERAGRDPDAVRIWSCLAAVPDGMSEDDHLRRGVGRLVTYFQAYGDALVSVNGWDPGVWHKLKTSDLFVTAASAGGAIDATADTETLQRLGEMVPEQWLAASAHGSSEDAAKTIVRELELGCHSVILHGAEPHEIAPMVQAYRAVRPTLKRAVATNPGLFA